MFVCFGRLVRVHVLFELDVIARDIAGIMPNVKIEQRVHLKFVVKSKKSATECFKLSTEVYGEETMSRTRFFEWHKKFIGGRREEMKHPGRLSTSKTDENVQKVDKIVRNDRRLGVYE